MRNIYLILYYTLVRYLPMSPFPLFKLFYKIRLFFVKNIIKECGENVVVKNNCYFGKGDRLSVGSRSQLGKNSRLEGTITIGKDVLMGPDVIMMSTSHEYSSLDIPINQQGEAREDPIFIGDDCWIGTRVIILPGVRIGSHSIVGAGSLVTKSVPSNSIIGGLPAVIIKKRT